jgi:hypothetical protein
MSTVVRMQGSRSGAADRIETDGRRHVTQDDATISEGEDTGCQARGPVGQTWRE